MPQPQHKGEYPPDWRDIANKVKDDAHGSCVRCGKAHDSSTGYTLTVHHFNGDKSCCERWNLVALCQRCHLSVQARVDPMVPLMFDPSKWCMPYIAGFYEANHGTPGPLYDLSRWIAEYVAAVGEWPPWAPRHSQFPSTPEPS